MPERKPDIDGAGVVLLGSFNPTIFQPEWFARQKLLPQAEVDVADIELIAPPITQFETERFVVQVSGERFSAVSKANTNAALLRDLVLGTFYILEHTPVRAMGIDRLMHFSVASEQLWHQVGDRLVPKEAWNAVLGGRPGMKSLSILTDEGGSQGGTLTVKVEPSSKMKWGVFFETNEHREVQKADQETLIHFMNILKDHWDEAQAYASKIANHILDWTTSQQHTDQHRADRITEARL